MSEPSPRARFTSLETRLLWGTVLVIALVMGALIAIVEHRQRSAIVDEVQRRGTVLAQHLASMSSGALLLYNFTALEQNVVRMDRETDVAYAIILDREGTVAAHSQESQRVGLVLTDPVSGGAARAEAPLVQEVVTASGERLYDFAVPLLIDDRKWGTVRVGLSRTRMEAEIQKTRRELFALAAVILVGGGLAAALVARRIARPVRRLADGVAAVSRGELDLRIEPTTSDEIGQLALAFNDMAGELAQQRTALEGAHTELRQRFTELSDLKSYTDNILGSLTSGVITLDLEGRVVTVNAAAELLTARALAEVRGCLVTEAFADIPELAELVTETRVRRVRTGLLSTISSRRDAPVPVEMTVAPLRGAEGRDLGVVLVLRDLSAVRQLEAELRRSERLAALGTLAARLAHEIKNPLTSLLTFTRHLARRFGDERFRQRFQSVVPRELERINAIVDGLLRLARPTRLSLRSLDLPGLLDQTLELFLDRIEAKPITVVREYTPGLPALQADPEHLYQVFTNLIVNALDAMEDGGRLTLRAAWSEGSELIEPGTRWGRDGRLRVEVEDTGTGIPASQLAEVFNPFFTTKPSGTGLGLAVVHRIVEDHGGTVTVRSSPGRGTTFSVLLPLTADRGLLRHGVGDRLRRDGPRPAGSSGDLHPGAGADDRAEPSEGGGRVVPL